jgi:hypothetical protein
MRFSVHCVDPLSSVGSDRYVARHRDWFAPNETAQLDFAGGAAQYCDLRLQNYSSAEYRKYGLTVNWQVKLNQFTHALFTAPCLFWLRHIMYHLYYAVRTLTSAHVQGRVLRLGLVG